MIARPDASGRNKPRLRLPGWLTEINSYYAKTDGLCWWYEERQDDGSIKRFPLVPQVTTTEGFK